MSEHQRNVSVRHRLLAQREELRTRHSRIQRDLRREAEALVADGPDQAIQRANDEALIEIDEATSTELAAIDAALVRLKSGRYGICSCCHVPIDSGRLAVVPYADLCASCALKGTASPQ